MAELETRWRDLGEFIREQRRVGHLSLRKLSEMAGISNPYLSQIERGLRKPSAEILQQIARALEISSETLYVRAGILEPREGDTDLVTEIRRDSGSTRSRRRPSSRSTSRSGPSAGRPASSRSSTGQGDASTTRSGADLEIVPADGSGPAMSTIRNPEALAGR